MTQVTIRGIDPDIETEIRRIARENGKSINQAIKEMLHKQFETNASNRPAASLKQLAGGWSKEEAEIFERSIAMCEQIDEDMWQ
ncbi:MAG: hypothetical protein K9K64_15540 [Desulfohalobiaceae bacterium]|nr:hypothetical protein [Desulfohalobiaceae bacterium]